VRSLRNRSCTGKSDVVEGVVYSGSAVIVIVFLCTVVQNFKCLCESLGNSGSDPVSNATLQCYDKSQKPGVPYHATSQGINITRFLVRYTVLPMRLCFLCPFHGFESKHNQQ
jgi:hypothetical protein